MLPAAAGCKPGPLLLLLLLLPLFGCSYRWSNYSSRSCRPRPQICCPRTRFTRISRRPSYRPPSSSFSCSLLPAASMLSQILRPWHFPSLFAAPAHSPLLLVVARCQLIRCSCSLSLAVNSRPRGSPLCVPLRAASFCVSSHVSVLVLCLVL